MKYRIYQQYLLVLILTISISACRNHEIIEANAAGQGYADSQMVGTWKVTGYVSDAPYDWNNDGTAETNIYNNWTTCQKDNLFNFRNDKTGAFKFNCSLNLEGTWFIVATKFIVFTPNGYSSESEKIISMTSAQFKSTIDVTAANGGNFTLTKTWTRQ